jgi:cell fate regulator YaaT (PSP1 superfamily)
VVESAVGYDIGQITLSGDLVRLQMKKKRVNEKTYEFKPILRIAKEHELQLLKQVREKEKETMLKARILARKLGLNMKLGDVEYQADGRKAIFYYFADGRVDFRELIKVLATEFKIKIEMRQIGARQEAGIVGGIGSCGRELCCSTWLTSFKSVNTSAARYQNLSINQTKLSGQCGRLKCCLNYELDTYLDALKGVPEHAEKVFTEVGEAHLVKTDVLKGLMFYQYQRDSKFYPLPFENVSKILELNRAGKKPADLIELAVEEKEKEEKIEFADVVGHISLASLDKHDRKKRFKDKNKQNSGPRQGQGQAQNQQPKQTGQQPGQQPANKQRSGNNQNRRPNPNRNNPNNPNRNNPNNPNNPKKPDNPNPPKE